MDYPHDEYKIPNSDNETDTEFYDAFQTTSLKDYIPYINVSGFIDEYHFIIINSTPPKVFLNK